MTRTHPDLAAEQAHIDHAYDCLERSRTDAWKLRRLSEAGLGGTFQARYERDVFDEALVQRLTQLDLGDAALVFGRIDRDSEDDGRVESFHIGRLAISDENREPVVVDWRAPVAEPFYRATGRDPMGLVRRRHFAVAGRMLEGIEDELFGSGHLGVGGDEGLGDGAAPGDGRGLRGYSTLMSALERGRTGQLGDIVATIQSEQDEIIRSPQHGVLVVQGGPGTGKTVVALHRAAYLLYTHRFPLEDQGVLVIGPNRVFLRYIEKVLPSLGEAGVELVVLADLVRDVGISRTDTAAVARVKGRIEMSRVVAKAVRDRERALSEDVVFPFRTGYVRLRAEETARIVKAARRRYRRHNAARRWVEGELWSAIAATWRTEVEIEELRDALRATDEFRAALERIWPVLRPAELLHDLFGSRALLRLAGTDVLAPEEIALLHRERSEDWMSAPWTDSDVALLDEAHELLGPPPGRGGKVDEADEIRTYGHIVVDEVQDLTPMQLRMVSRRSLNGSMTVVGDIAQATGPLAPDDWDDVLAHLAGKREPRVAGLSVGYRIPAQIMALADGVMLAATPGLRAPTSVRVGEHEPRLVRADAERLWTAVAGEVAGCIETLAGSGSAGNIAVVCADRDADAASEALAAAGIGHVAARTGGLDAQVSVVPVSLVKGLELDAVVVVEPAAIVDGDVHGLRSLYVALTRSTRMLSVVHSRELPASLEEARLRAGLETVSPAVR
jgi:DNA helicase IV